VHGRFPIFVGKGETVSRWLLSGLSCAGAGIYEIEGHPVFNQGNSLAGHPLAIERRAELLRMVNVVENLNVCAEKRLAHGLIQTGALIIKRSRRKIVKEKAH